MISNSSFRAKPITISLILISCFISVITWFGSVYTTLDWFYYDQSRILSGQIWRVLTPIFLHFPAMGIIFAHLAFNMIWLFQFGALIERYDSSRFLLGLVLVSGSISNVSQAQASVAGLFGGMSGVVYALLAYLFVIKRLKPSYPGQVPDNIAYFLIGFMAIAALGVLGNNIANTAHLVGFLVGAVFALFRSKQKTTVIRRW